MLPGCSLVDIYAQINVLRRIFEANYIIFYFLLLTRKSLLVKWRQSNSNAVEVKMMQFVPKCIYSLFALNIRAHFIACSVNISDYLSKRDYGLANYSFDIVCIDNMFGGKEITGGKCR